MNGNDTSFPVNLTPYNYVSFRSEDPVMPLTLGGKLSVPTSSESRMPAVVIAHGSTGPDSRGAYYAALLNRAGMATLEIDMFAERGYGGWEQGRPRSIVETLPDAFGALRMLGSDARMDPDRIGIMGFSFGGAVTMLTATLPYWKQFAPPGLKFAAHAPLYPVCWSYNTVPGHEFRELTGSPVFLQAGEIDAYDNPTSAPELVAHLSASAREFVSCVVYPHATHAWDRFEPAVTVRDPFSHRGQGGSVDFVPNPVVRAQSGRATVDFFRKVFRL